MALPTILYGALSNYRLERHEPTGETMLPIIVAVLGFAPLPVRAGDDCRYEETRAADIAASGISLLDLEAGAGSLRVEGKAGVRTITVRGRACASSRALLSEVQIRARRNGGTYVVVAEGPDNTDHDDYARMDLVIEVPLSMAARISDGSGSAELSGLGELRVSDGSGELEIDGITGDVRVDDGSGTLTITNVQGDVTIDDGSGEVTLREIDGNVTVSDGSGSISAHGVTGTVNVKDDGSGSVEVAKVGGDFIAMNSGSGSIRYSAVNGRVRVPSRSRH
jgi:DUF4097 and DUF4098 domain-containing protein YvlB